MIVNWMDSWKDSERFVVLKRIVKNVATVMDMLRRRFILIVVRLKPLPETSESFLMIFSLKYSRPHP